MNQLINLFKLLSDETRLRILMLLAKEELCVCQITGILDITQPTASKILAKLRDMNLVTDLRKEKYVFYKLKQDNPVLLRMLQDISNQIENYPKLLSDRNRLDMKDQLLKQCSIRCD